MSNERLYSINEVARAFAVPVSTLRYYDEIRLVPATTRRSRVRHYDQRALRQLAYAQLWRLDAMLSIEQTEAILASHDHQRRNQLIQRHRAELAERIRRLREADKLLAHCLRCTADSRDDCSVITAYLDEQVRVRLEQPHRSRETAMPALLRAKESVVTRSGHSAPVR